MTHPTRLDWFILAILGLFFGASFMGVSVALQGFGPLSIAAYRIALGALLLVVFAKASGRRMPALSAPNGVAVWAAAIAMGAFSNAIPFFLLGWAQAYVASGFAGVSMAAMPLITLILAHFLVPGERITLRRLIGILIGLAGVLVLIGPSAFESTGLALENTARLVCLAAGACYAIGSIVARLCPDVDRRAFAATALVAATVMIVPVALWQEGIPRELPSALPVLSVILLGIFPTALAQILLVILVRRAGPTFLSLVNYQVPLWALFLGAVLLGEALPSSLIWAMLLILIGVAISQLGALTRLFARDTDT
ncbi:DMT family transporter [Aliiroseovarius crassostreae]|uniref:DMT family transporter n=1 Tax=Aliiroseovarius crassostreae TaxID=154981 RepID=UPI0021F987A2|nr:DMT family transporter [Aliiroseovarius crassostreae]UWP97740.1 DMT family transporter [Aliiroseovarius crassostreae]